MVKQISETSHGFNMITFIISYICNIQCPMCFFACSPKRQEVLSQDLAFKILDDAKLLNIPVIGIAGGEPFLQMDFLRELVQKSASNNLTVIVVSNAYWAISEEKALSILTALNKLGLKRIQISLDEQHQEFIPISRIANAAKAAEALNFEDIMILGTSKGNSENFKYLIFYLQEILNTNIEKINIIDRPRTSHEYFEDSGQLRYSFEEIEHADALGLPIKKPGDCLSEMMVDVNGDLYPCCNNFIGRIGNLHKNGLDNILNELPQNKFFTIIKKQGPLEFAKYIDRNYNTNFSEREYGNWCEICARVFQDSRFRDLLMMSSG